MKKISILLPTYNEQQSLVLLYERLQLLFQDCSQYEWEVLFVNDGSTDNSLLLIHQFHLQDARINYVDLSRNYGKEIAMLAGFDFVTGDAMVIMDADLQHPPEVIGQMLPYWEKGYDDVYAQRRSSNESFFKNKSSQFYYKMLQKLTRIPIQKDTGDFRLLDRNCIEALKQLRESQRNTKALYSWIGFRKIGIEFDQPERIEGKTKWSLFQLINLAIDGITSFTVAPLRFSSIVGIIVSFVSFIYMIIILAKTLIFGEIVRGYSSLMITILFLSGVQLLAIGILGEYIGRIFNETKKRPGYFVNSYNGKKIIDKRITIG